MSTEALIAKAPKRARGVQRVAELLDAVTSSLSASSDVSTATFGDILLLPNRIASIASGMPCPRMASLP